MGSRSKSDKELGSISVGASISHGNNMRCVGDLEVFIIKGFTVYAFPSSSVAVGEVATLSHESRDDPVEDASYIADFLARAILGAANAEGIEVVDGFGDFVAKEADSKGTQSSIHGNSQLHSYRRGHRVGVGGCNRKNQSKKTKNRDKLHRCKVRAMGGEGP